MLANWAAPGKTFWWGRGGLGWSVATKLNRDCSWLTPRLRPQSLKSINFYALVRGPKITSSSQFCVLFLQNKKAVSHPQREKERRRRDTSVNDTFPFAIKWHWAGVGEIKFKFFLFGFAGSSHQAEGPFTLFVVLFWIIQLYVYGSRQTRVLDNAVMSPHWRGRRHTLSSVKLDLIELNWGLCLSLWGFFGFRIPWKWLIGYLAYRSELGDKVLQE